MTIDSLPDKYSQEKVQQWKTVVIAGGRLTEAYVSGQLKFAGKRTGPPPYKVRLSASVGPVQERVFAHQCQTYNDVPAGS